MVAVRSVDTGRVLEAAAAGSPLEAVEAVARELGEVFDADDVSFLIADLSGRSLVRLAHLPRRDVPSQRRGPLRDGERRDLEESATVVPFDGGPTERAVRTQEVQVLPPDPARSGEDQERWRILAPVTDRGESIGLLELYVGREPSREEVADIRRVAHLLALVVIANDRHTDLFQWGQRSRSFSLSAEIQQRLLPGPRACEADTFTLAGWLEPAATIGGDTFDYSLDRDVLHLSLTDAMGHGVGAALTASLCLGSLRGGRRAGSSLVEQVTGANAALCDEAAARNSEDFVTGIVARLDLRTGVCEIVNAGHVAPYLVHQERVTTLELPADLPLGLFADTAYRSTQVQLGPGDRVVFVTDGMLERNLDKVDLAGSLLSNRRLHPRELVLALADSALEAAGHELSDDATLLCLDWHGAAREAPTR